MSNTSNLRFILHVSDFHLNNSALEGQNNFTEVKNLLTALTQKLKEEKFKVDYLVHTGDVIDSGDLYNIVAAEMKLDKSFWESGDDEESGAAIEKFLYEEYKKAAVQNTELNKVNGDALRPTMEDLKEFDKRVAFHVENRFKESIKVMHTFATDLNVAFGNVVICSGNHDVLRPLCMDEDAVTCKKGTSDRWVYKYSKSAGCVAFYFNKFLNDLGTANSTNRCKGSPVCLGESSEACAECGETTFCSLDDMNVLILNTNWPNPKKQPPGYYCVYCSQVLDTIQRHIEEIKDPNKLNIIIAHKPVYEICEKARLSFKRYTKTTFFSMLQRFLGDGGIYLCGDKHTRSIVSSLFHDIPHYIGGEPIRVEKGHTADVEYNLIAISNGHVDMKRKLHLSYVEGTWKCEIRPQDGTVKALYKLCQKYINKECFQALGDISSFSTWEGLCQIIYNWTDETQDDWYTNIDKLYTPICRYRIEGKPNCPKDLLKEHLFGFVQHRIVEQMKHPSIRNVLNIRGEHSAGKSMFLGQFYIHLMIEYSKGRINFIPAYFNMENEEIYQQIESGGTYYESVKKAFRFFVRNVQELAKEERQAVCYFVDGLDELDCWSYSTEDSVGRELLNTLAEYDNAWYVMVFSQHHLPCFKNTMPLRKYNDVSDIMYFNPVDVNEEYARHQLTNFVNAYLTSKQFPSNKILNLLCDEDTVEFKLPSSERKDKAKANMKKRLLKDVCQMVKSFRRLTINPGFLSQNEEYLTEIDQDARRLRHAGESISKVYNYYIDRQHELCLEELGYGFVEYAPTMAYLFAYKGYTYERFNRLHLDSVQNSQHILEPIWKNSKKVYKTFLFIMKNKDAREYLIALHYNRELRYYAENPTEAIEEDSILNEFITRNIAVLIRKLWTDTNKFVIACKHLLQRKDLGNCVQSMLIYCLAHLQLYEPIRNRLQRKMFQKGKETLRRQGLWDKVAEQDTEILSSNNSMNQEFWKITGADDQEKLVHFQQLSLKHSMKILGLISEQDLQGLKEYYENAPEFWSYNRQHQMLYYGDLSIKGDANIHALMPGSDLVYAGFDFHDCFNYLYVKLMTDNTYPLFMYDLFTVYDLLISRLKCEHLAPDAKKENTFFYRNKDKDLAKDVFYKMEAILERFSKISGRQQLEMHAEVVNYLRKNIERAICKSNIENTFGME